MNSMYMKYSVEASTDDAFPTGKYYMDHMAAWLGAQEVVHTHLGLSGKALDEFMDKYFEKTWEHFDTAGTAEAKNPIARDFELTRSAPVTQGVYKKNINLFIIYFIHLPRDRQKIYPVERIRYALNGRNSRV